MLLERALAERHAGNPEAEFELLAQVLELDASHAASHERLAELTGPAPLDPQSSVDARVERALAHPYDPLALLVAGEGLASRGRTEEAVGYLEKAVWLADLHPQAALQALIKLRSLEESWAATRIVPVHVYADASLSALPGWRFQLRTLWLSASNSLGSVLSTRFVPIEIGRFETSALPNDLDEIHAAFAQTVPPPDEGILAAFTGRQVPSGKGVFKKGVAEFLGRSLAVRLAPGATQSRVLAHELLHLYGAIHVLDDVVSLMNPTSTSLVLDAPSIRIVRALHGRGFGPGGIEPNIVQQVDLRTAIAAFSDALSKNLVFRNAGIVKARGAWGERPDTASISKAKALDPHLGDVARVVGALMLADGRREDAVRLLDLSTQLYGGQGPRARQTAQQAERLRGALPDAGRSANQGEP